MGLRYRIKYRLDITVLDERNENTQVFAGDKFLSKTLTISGTREKIKEKLCAKIDYLTNLLNELYYGKDEEEEQNV